MSNASGLDLFHVKLDSGEERRFDLDQLDAAYKAGLIHEGTLVLRAGALRWVKLAELAGLDEPEEPMPSSIAPMAVDTSEAPIDLTDFGPALATSEVPRELRPRRSGKKIFAVAIALAVVGGLGFAATRARPQLASSIKTTVTTQLAKVTKSTPKSEPRAAAAAAIVAPPPVPSPQAPAAAPPAPVTNVAAPVTTSTTSVPTMTASSLPDAKDAKKKSSKKSGARTTR